MYSSHTELQNPLSCYNPAQRWQIHGLLMPPNQPDFARCQTQGTALTNVGNMLFHRRGDDVSMSCLKKSFFSSSSWLCLDSFTSALPGFSSNHLLLSKSCFPGDVLTCCWCQWLHPWRVRMLTVVHGLLVTSLQHLFISPHHLGRIMWLLMLKEGRTEPVSSLRFAGHQWQQLCWGWTL